MKTLIITLSLLGVTLFQTNARIVKNNGESVSLRSIEIFQDKISSGGTLFYNHNGAVKSIALKDIRRINLKEVSQKNKGVTTWNALLVKRDDQKLEIEIAIDKISGVNSSGEKITISAGSIDKLSF